jgi:hypothetical protein
MADLTEYKVECTYCGRIVIVPQIDSPLPIHPEKGHVVRPGIPYTPCPGSGIPGLFVDIIPVI